MILVELISFFVLSARVVLAFFDPYSMNQRSQANILSVLPIETCFRNIFNILTALLSAGELLIKVPVWAKHAILPVPISVVFLHFYYV